jgi:hypothetical protein
MAKNKRRKSSRKKPVARPPVTPTAGQQTLTKVISNVSFYMSITPAIPFMYMMSRDYGISTERNNLLWASALIYLGVVFIKSRIHARIRALPMDTYANQSIHRKFRSYSVWLIVLSIFTNISVLVPILYYEGYLTKWAALLPGKTVLSNNMSIGIAFGLGAVISGVLGNLAYDILKYAVRKTMERKN